MQAFAPSSFLSPFPSHHPRPTKRYVRHAPTLSVSDQKIQRRSLDRVDVPPFNRTLTQQSPTHSPLCRRPPTTLQINIGLTCNLACRHCHVESSPSRLETMPRIVADRLLHLTRLNPSIKTVDITGGAPEMHDMFRYLVTHFSAMGKQVIDRCNLTVLETEGQHDLVQFLAENRAKVVASMPCYSPENVERQRGNGVFDASIRALQQLNQAGYGRPGSGLQLDLVYNPGGASLPPPQQKLEQDYKMALKEKFDIEFSNLICITNMPIKRFADDLLIQNNLNDYMSLLVSAFNPGTVDSLMCLDMVHVAWDGRFYDCDFNYALEMTMNRGANRPIAMKEGLSVFDIDSFEELVGRGIATGKHCYGCTAGSGSSCGGSLS